LDRRQVTLPPIYIEAARAAGSLIDELNPLAVPQGR
jgi:hypothetical protein